MIRSILKWLKSWKGQDKDKIKMTNSLWVDTVEWIHKCDMICVQIPIMNSYLQNYYSLHWTNNTKRYSEECEKLVWMRRSYGLMSWLSDVTDLWSRHHDSPLLIQTVFNANNRSKNSIGLVSIFCLHLIRVHLFC